MWCLMLSGAIWISSLYVTAYMELSCCDELVYMMIMMSTKLTCGFEVLIIYALLINVYFTNLALIIHFQALLYPFYLLLAKVAYKDLFWADIDALQSRMKKQYIYHLILVHRCSHCAFHGKGQREKHYLKYRYMHILLIIFCYLIITM